MAIPTRVIVEMRHEKASSAGTAKTLLSGEQSARPGRTLMREWRRVIGRQLVSGEQGCREHHRAQLKARAAHAGSQTSPGAPSFGESLDVMYQKRSFL